MTVNELLDAVWVLGLASGLSFALIGGIVTAVESLTGCRLDRQRDPEGKWGRRCLFGGLVLVAVGLVALNLAVRRWRD